MAKTYKASITISCLKQHTCVGCGSQFAYVFTREVTGEAPKEEQALLNAQEAANKAAENEVDLHACPQCGLVQPEMIADKRSTRFWWGLALAIVGLATAMILGGMDVITIAQSAYIAAGVAGGVLIWNLLGCLYNPNKNLEANRASSQAQLIEKASERWDEPAQEVGGLSFAHWLGLMFFVGGGLVALIPVGLATINDWTQNTTTSPEVCGPGDMPCIYFHDEIKSVKGYWKGDVTAFVKNANELGLEKPIIQGKTKDSNWGDTISGKSVSNNTNTMWAKVLLPADADLAGKTIQLSLLVDVVYPFRVDNGFNKEQRVFTHDTKLTLSSPNSGQTYVFAWWTSQAAALGLAIAGSMVLLATCQSLRKQAHPTTIAPLDEPGDEE